MVEDHRDAPTSVIHVVLEVKIIRRKLKSRINFHFTFFRWPARENVPQKAGETTPRLRVGISTVRCVGAPAEKVDHTSVEVTQTRPISGEGTVSNLLAVKDFFA